MPRRSWSTEEDESLRGAVATHGVKAWSAVSCALPGRTGKACRERWFGHLNPALVPEVTLCLLLKTKAKRQTPSLWMSGLLVLSLEDGNSK